MNGGTTNGEAPTAPPVRASFRNLSRPEECMSESVEKAGSPCQGELLSADDVFAASIPYADMSRPQVYFLIDGDRIVYVGKTMRAGSRLHLHVADGKKFDRVAFIECESVEQMSELEFAYICKFDPPLNSVLPSIPGVMPLDRARKEYGFDRLHLRRAMKAGRVAPVYHGRLGTWITPGDAELLGEIARGA